MIKLALIATVLALLPAGSLSAPTAVAPEPIEVALAAVGNATDPTRCEIDGERPAAVPHASAHTQGRSPSASAHHAKAADAHHSPPEPISHHALHETREHVPTPVPLLHDEHMVPSLHDEHAATAACDPTAEQRAAADRLVAEVRSALTRRFDIPEKAMLAGYQGGHGPRNQTHYFSREEQANPRVLDPNHPEGLVYDGRTVIAALFIMPKVEDSGPRVGGCLTTWHRHDEERGGVTPEMLHVWIVPNPNGQFANKPPS